MVALSLSTRKLRLDIADYLECFSLKEQLRGESPDSAYIKNLRIENGQLVNGMGYPADWDLSESYTNLAPGIALDGPVENWREVGWLLNEIGLN